MAPGKRRGVSKRVQESVGSSTSQAGIDTPPSKRVLTASHRLRQREEASQLYKLQRQGLTSDLQQCLDEIRGDDQVADDPDPVYIGADDDDDGGDWEDVSNLSGDQELARSMRELILEKWHGRRYIDGRTRRQRRQRAWANWQPLMTPMVEAYLSWKYPPTADTVPLTTAAHTSTGTTTGTTTDTPTGSQAPDDHPSPSAPADPQDNLDFEVQVIDIFSLSTTVTIHRQSHDATAVAFVRNGYIPPSPFSPSIVIATKTMELFRRLRLRKPSFSVEAFAKVLCDFYNTPYRYSIRNALAEAFDIYLLILRDIDKQVQAALGRDTKDWRVLQGCPPCGYELRGEPPLKFRRMVVVDGNNSLKRVARVGDRNVADTRLFNDGDYFLPPAYVDQFAGEVPRRRASDNVEDSDEEDQTPDDPEPVDGGVDTSPCADNWKAAAASEKKKMWAVFDETGVFVCACRHGLVLWVADMIRSGELAKYPLAMVAKTLETLGSDILMGYDIGCSFSSTMRRSSLSIQAQEARFRLCVNAFHGYSHNYACQMKNHPNIIQGMGLEDLETLERAFSSSNQLARIVRYASAFRRRLYIDTYFHQWDDDKYANLGSMLLGNYRQALKIIEEDSQALQEAMASSNITFENLSEWKEEQQTYFATLGQEPAENLLAIEYVELLIQLRDLGNKTQAANSSFINTSFTTFTNGTGNRAYEKDLSATRKAETERRYVHERYQNTLRDVIEMEVKMGIDRRWEVGDKEFQETLKYLRTRRYQRALDNLQKLVIQRLFELQKMNLAGTGYKLRTHIAKSLQTRCKAVQRAINVYNAAALDLDPPRPQLNWSEVSHYGFLEDFDLMRETREDIRAKPWVQPLFREMIRRSNRLERAQEEIQRCNIECRRLLTSVIDEEKLFAQVEEKLNRSNSPIAGALQEFTLRRCRVNDYVLARLYQIYQLPGFTGDRSIGTHINAHEPNTPVGMDDRANQDIINSVEVDDGEGDAELDTADDANAEVDRLMDFISDLATAS